MDKPIQLWITHQKPDTILTYNPKEIKSSLELFGLLMEKDENIYNVWMIRPQKTLIKDYVLIGAIKASLDWQIKQKENEMAGGVKEIDPKQWSDPDYIEQLAVSMWEEIVNYLNSH